MSVWPTLPRPRVRVRLLQVWSHCGTRVTSPRPADDCISQLPEFGLQRLEWQSHQASNGSHTSFSHSAHARFGHQSQRHRAVLGLALASASLSFTYNTVTRAHPDAGGVTARVIGRHWQHCGCVWHALAWTHEGCGFERPADDSPDLGSWVTELPGTISRH